MSRFAVPLAATILSACSGSNGVSGFPTPQQMPNTVTSNSVGSTGTGLLDSSRARAQAAASVESYASSVLAAQPAAYYSLADSGSSLVDSSGNSLNGTYGSAVAHNKPAVRGTAASAGFPGGNYSAADFDSVATSSRLQPQNALTIEAWFKEAAANSSSSYISIVSYGREVQGATYAVQISPTNHLHVYLTTTAGTKELDSQSEIVPGKPYYVAVAFNTGYLSLYVDGRLDSTMPVNAPARYAGAFGLGIGGAQGGRWNTFDGDISDVAIYGTCLTESTIASHYAAGNAASSSVAPSPSPSPIATAAPVSGNYDEDVTNDKALAFYRMNDSGSALVDAIHGTNGKYGAGVTHTSAPLTSDAGFSSIFSGAQSATAIVSPATALQASTGVSLELWVKFSSISSTMMPIASYGSQAIGAQPFGVYLSNGQINFQVHPRFGGMEVHTGPLQTNVPYHVIGTYDGSTVSLYLNGSLVSTAKTAGAFVYPSNGFAIGSLVNGTEPNFAGAIAAVSIYDHALSPARVMSHYIDGLYAPIAAEMPAAAQSFVDSIGVVTHFGESVYSGPNYNTVVSKLVGLGIKHIREGTVEEPSFEQHLNALATQGIKSTIVTALNESDQDIKQYPTLIPNSIEAYEGPNEPNYGPSTWPQDTRNTMMRLHADVKGTPALAHLPIIAPALSSGLTTLGDLSAYVDYGNVHDYFATFNPGTNGWGSVSSYGVYGSLSYNMNLVSVESGTHPIMATETGYGSTVSPGAQANVLNYATDAKYIPRTYFVHWNAGILRTFDYEFLDEDSSGLDFTNNGLLDVHLQAKPAYNALHSIISDLADTSDSFTRTALVYSLTGNMDNVRHTLLQKADGTYYLALWIETRSYENGVDLPIAPQTITLTTHDQIETASQMTLDVSGNSSVETLSGTPGPRLTLKVTDQISIVHLKM